MKTGNELLRIKDLHTGFRIQDTYFDAVDHISLTLRKNEVLAIVGESGCGKSTLASSIIGLHDHEKVRIQGEILYNDKNIATMSEDELNKIRGVEISMIFQDPLSALNPLMRIGDQIEEGLIYHTNLTKSERKKYVLELLHQVGISNPKRVVKQFPHQLSGGMRQRVMIAMALVCNPKLLIADEPTTALDVTIQAQILKLIKELNDRLQMAVLLITHDLGVVAKTCHRVIVMYAGQIVEEANVHEIFKNPQHPYTLGLIKSVPDMRYKKDTLYSIPGNVPKPGSIEVGCRFASRCEFAMERCANENPSLYEVNAEEGHRARCFLLEEKGGFSNVESIVGSS